MKWSLMHAKDPLQILAEKVSNNLENNCKSG